MRTRPPAPRSMDAGAALRRRVLRMAAQRRNRRGSRLLPGPKQARPLPFRQQHPNREGHATAARWILRGLAFSTFPHPKAPGLVVGQPLVCKLYTVDWRLTKKVGWFPGSVCERAIAGET